MIQVRYPSIHGIIILAFPAFSLTRYAFHSLPPSPSPLLARLRTTPVRCTTSTTRTSSYIARRTWATRTTTSRRRTANTSTDSRPRIREPPLPLPLPLLALLLVALLLPGMNRPRPRPRRIPQILCRRDLRGRGGTTSTNRMIVRYACLLLMQRDY